MFKYFPHNVSQVSRFNGQATDNFLLPRVNLWLQDEVGHGWQPHRADVQLFHDKDVVVHVDVSVVLGVVAVFDLEVAVNSGTEPT